MTKLTLKATSVALPFHSVRNITSPEDSENGRKVITGQLPLQSILTLPTDENVRTYLVDAPGKKLRRPTAVHRAILDTLVNRPDDFSVLNGGIVLVARDYEVDEKTKTLKLLSPSIINGSQTQGVIQQFVKECHQHDQKVPDVHVKFEAIITEDDGLIAEVSIARNFQNDVLSISIAGRRGQLDELERAVQKKLPEFKLRKSETDLAEEFLETEHLLQVITLLVPQELWLKKEEPANKVYAYARKSQCLREFSELYDAIHNGKQANWLKGVELDDIKRLYQFYLDVAAQAYELHQKWSKHKDFKGTQLHAISRGKNGEILMVPDGIIFPILAALSAFAVETEEGWTIQQPEFCNDVELIQAAKEAYIEVAKSNPSNMGRTKACYSSLHRITSIYGRLSKQNFDFLQ
jgi:predicted ester cyclase